MNKKLLSLLLLVVAAFTTAFAQQELTVYDGTGSSGYVPAYMGYWDDFTRSQYVIPAADLEEMNGGTISAMKFYTTTQNVPYTSVSTADVYLMEVDYTTISAFEPKANATMVYQGTVSIVTNEAGDGGEMTIEFATPFIYTGGNLLIGMENTTDAGYKFIYFFGQTVEGASIANYNSSSLDNVTAYQRNFIPKTTFTYVPSGGVIVPKPTNLQVSNLGPNSATLSWTAGGTETLWDVEYKKAADEEWTQETATAPTIELDALASATEYLARVRANAGDGNTSAWVNTSFTTPLCDPDDMGEITYELTDSYGDGWSGNAIEIVAPNGLVVESLTVASGSSASGTVALCYGIEYTIRWKLGSYPGECSYVLTGPDGAEIVSGAGLSASGVLTTYMLPAPGQGMVKNVEVTDITATTATVNWVGEQETYNVRYRTVGYPGGEIEGFEYEGLQSGDFPTESGWTTIDADGDGYAWYIFAPDNTTDGNGNPTVFDGACMTSASYMQSALTPDDWLISPQVELKGIVRMWLRGQDPGYAAEHFAVYVSTVSNNNVADFVELIPETVATGVYTEYTADLSAYAGQMGYIGIRHFNCTDEFRLNLDNFLIQDPEAVIEDGEWITAEAVTNPYTIEGLTPETDYEVQVQGIFEEKGTTNWTESVFFTTLEAPFEPEEGFFLVGSFNEWNQTAEGGRLAFDEYDKLEGVEFEAGAEFKVIAFDEAGTIWFGGEDANGVGYFLLNNDLMGQGIMTVQGDSGANFRVEEAGTYNIELAVLRDFNGAVLMTVTKEDPSAISTIAVDSQSNEWYNLNGQKLNGKPTVPGIYINGNKKVVIK